MDISPLIISIKTSLVATLITFILGIVISYKIFWYKGRYESLIDTMLTLPLVLPPTVVGFFILITIGKNGPVGMILKTIDINLIFTWTATVISAVIVSFPIMYRSLKSSFEQIDNNMIFAAKTLGLSEKEIFMKIMLPISYPGIIGAVILSFARAIGEFGATLMIAGNIPGKTQTMPIAIFFAVESGDMNKAMIWVMIIIGISAIVITISNFISKSRDKKFGKGN
ncbi:molybdenum ABC transporter permease subunit [Paraclostridium bifermentans]|uniref:molybdate ABC transporter permease subunit n=1 Tax=Paraclostridium TaxID=1849822 RepID=UPI00038DA599|nr:MULTISPECIES: molybdate ABC transporter permease subunit [Paraclostridium]MCU9808858.1 molybdate ABC transporter permease subunit [Paraclostridium sp. AKS46]EQK46001.1 molybdate ABC transporter, permease protein [[Clostridium] bifermentans ATCC 19299] [Paraclostridium bifermentans ATCC 19299]MDU0298568.1 molybdate ABC transporter permease subunit [Paraclostridium sp. MRS3W1]GKZ04512.1 molybdenum ABC transporter permease subunit [Paraclostridium bifermentans]GKZ06137.1 molybdenum ABC transpo